MRIRIDLLRRRAGGADLREGRAARVRSAVSLLGLPAREVEIVFRCPDWREKLLYLELHYAADLKPQGLTASHLVQIARGARWREKLEAIRRGTLRPLRGLGFNASHLARVLCGADWAAKARWLGRRYPLTLAKSGFTPFDVSQLCRSREWKAKLSAIETGYDSALRSRGFTPPQVVRILSGAGWREKLDWIREGPPALFRRTGLDAEEGSRILLTKDWKARLEWLRDHRRAALAAFRAVEGRGINLLKDAPAGRPGEPGPERPMSNHGLFSILSSREWREKLEWVEANLAGGRRGAPLDAAGAALILKGPGWREKLEWMASRYLRTLRPLGFDSGPAASIASGREWRAKVGWLEARYEAALKPLGFGPAHAARLMRGRGWRSKLAWIEDRFRPPADSSPSGVRVNLLEPPGEEGVDLTGSHLSQIMTGRDWEEKFDWIQAHYETFKAMGFTGPHVAQGMKHAGWARRFERIGAAFETVLRPRGFSASHVAQLLGRDGDARLRWIEERYDRDLRPLGFNAALATQILKGSSWRSAAAWVASRHASRLASLGLRPHHVAVIARGRDATARLEWAARRYAFYKARGLTPGRLVLLLQREDWRKALARLEANRDLLDRLKAGDERISPLAEHHLAGRVFDGEERDRILRLFACCRYDAVARFAERVGEMAPARPARDPAEVLRRLADRFGYTQGEVKLYLAALNKNLRGLLNWHNTGRKFSDRTLSLEGRGGGGPRLPAREEGAPDSVESAEAIDAVLSGIRRRLPGHASILELLTRERGCDVSQLDEAETARLHLALAALRADKELLARVGEILE